MASRGPVALLLAQGAPSDLIAEIATMPRIADDWQGFHDECPRADWFLAVMLRVGVDHAVLVRAAAACARLVLDDLDAEEAKRVLDLAAHWTAQAPSADLEAAMLALDAAVAGSSDPASKVAASVVRCVGLGTRDRHLLVDVPAGVAEVAMLSAIDCGADIASRWAHDRCVALLRAAVSWEELSALVPEPYRTP